MGKTFLVELIKVANELDSRGLVKEADLLDKITNNSLESYGLTLSTGPLKKEAGWKTDAGRAVLKWSGAKYLWGLTRWTKAKIITVGVTGTGIGSHIGQNYNELASAAGLATGVDFDTTPWNESYDIMLEHLLEDDVCAGDGLYADSWPADANPSVKQTIRNKLKRLTESEAGFGDDPEGAFQNVLKSAQSKDDKFCAAFYNEESYGMIFDAIWAQARMEGAAAAVGVDISDPQWLCDLGDEIGFGQDTGECPNLANMDDWVGFHERRVAELEVEAEAEGEAEDSLRADLKDQIAGLDAELGTTTDTDGLSVAQLEGHLRRLERDQGRVSGGGAPIVVDTDPGRDPFEPWEPEPEPEPEPEAEPEPGAPPDEWDW